MNVPTSTADRAPIEPRQQRQERALLGRDLHARDRAELARLVDERELHRVGRRAVPDEVLGELGREEKRLGGNLRVGHRGKLIHVAM